MGNMSSSTISVKKLIANILKFSFVSVFSAVLSIIVLPLISRVFPPEEYGKINMFFTAGNMLMVFALAGLDIAYIRFFYEPLGGMNRKQLFLFPILFGSAISISAFVLITTINPTFISKLIFGEINIFALFLLLLYIISLIIFRQLNTTYRMEQNAKQYNIQNLLKITVNRVAFVLVAFIAPSYIYAISFITVGMLLLTLFYLRKQIKFGKGLNLNIPRDTLKKLLMFSFPLMPATLIVWLNNSTAKFILSGLGHYDEIGKFAIATSLANIFSIIPAGFAVYWSSFMYSSYKTEGSLIQKVHNYIMIISICVILTVFLSQDILYGILGPNYRISQFYFMLIMLNPIQSLINETTSYGIIIANKTHFHLISSVLGYVVNILICVFAIPKMGAFGAAAGIAFSSITILLVKTIIGQSLYRSIERYSKTIIGLSILIFLCFANSLLYSSLYLRCVVSLVVLALSFVIYRTEILSFFTFVFKYVVGKFRCV